MEIVTGGFPIPGEVALPCTEAPKALAGAVARIAVERFTAGKAQDPGEIDANYVRRSDAERLWRDP